MSIKQTAKTVEELEQIILQQQQEIKKHKHKITQQEHERKGSHLELSVFI